MATFVDSLSLQNDFSSSNAVRCHYSVLVQALGAFPDLLLSVSTSFYQCSIIDLHTKVSVNQSGNLTGASILVDHIMMKIDQSDHYLPLVLDILREEVALTDIVHKMEGGMMELEVPTDAETLESEPAPILSICGDTSGTVIDTGVDSTIAVSNSGASVTDTSNTVTNTDATVTDTSTEGTNSVGTVSDITSVKVADTISAAERLKDSFESLCFLAMMVINRTAIDLALLKPKIHLHLQYTRENASPEVQQHLVELDECMKAESVIMFLINRNFLSYFNFYFLEAFKPVLLSDKFNKKFDGYRLAHKRFIMNNFQNIVEAFRLNEDLRPTSIVGLPKILVELNSPWESKSPYNWMEQLNDIVDWGQYIIVTRLEVKSAIRITYHVLPFIIPRVVNDLTNETIVKRLTVIGATVTIPDELLQDGIADNQWIMNTVLEHRQLKGTTRSNKERDNPVTTETTSTTDQPLEEQTREQRLMNITEIKDEEEDDPVTKETITADQPPEDQPLEDQPLEEVTPKLPFNSSALNLNESGGYDDEMFLSPPSEDLQCPVCYLVVREPRQLTCCGATLCQVCSDSTSASVLCPCCRDTNHETLVDKSARRKVMGLLVKCTVPDCHWIGELLDLKIHLTVKGKCPQQIGYDASIVPVWCHQELSSLQYGTLPVYRTISNFNELKQNDAKVFTDPFYTSDGGYRATLAVYPNGIGPGKGTHVSAYISLMKGANDDNLEFPFTGIFTPRILNWRSNSYHMEESISFDDDIPMKCRTQVTVGERASGPGISLFLPHDDLIRYLHQDMMCFKIGFHPIKQAIDCSPVPSWYDADYCAACSAPPCTRTLYSYSAYKKTNSEWLSQPFYSSDNGYKLQLRVDANGSGSGQGSHLSLYVALMRGECDNALAWPFNAIITVQLLNWPSDSHHEEKIISHHKAPALRYRRRVFEGTTAPCGWGDSQFISHSSLESTSDPSVRFINDDNICFRILDVGIIEK